MTIANKLKILTSRIKTSLNSYNKNLRKNCNRANKIVNRINWFYKNKFNRRKREWNNRGYRVLKKYKGIMKRK